MYCALQTRADDEQRPKFAGLRKTYCAPQTRVDDNNSRRWCGRGRTGAAGLESLADHAMLADEVA